MVSVLLRPFLLFVLGLAFLCLGIYLYYTQLPVLLCAAPLALGLTMTIHYPLEMCFNWKNKTVFEQLRLESTYKKSIKEGFWDYWILTFIVYALVIGFLLDELSYPYFRLHYVIFYVSVILTQLYLTVWHLPYLEWSVFDTDSVTVLRLWKKPHSYTYRQVTAWELKGKSPEHISLYFERDLVKIDNNTPHFKTIKTLLETELRSLREHNFSFKSKFTYTYEYLLLIYPILAFLITHLIIIGIDVFHHFHLPEDKLVCLPKQQIDTVRNPYVYKISFIQNSDIVYCAQTIDRLCLKDSSMRKGETVDAYILQSDYETILHIQHAQTFMDLHWPGMVEEVDICALQHKGKVVFDAHDYQNSMRTYWMYFWAFILLSILFFLTWAIF